MIQFKDKYGKKLKKEDVFKKILNRLYNYFLDFELFLLYYIGYFPSHMLRRFFFRLAGMKIGKGSTIHIGSRFFQPKNIEIGEDTIVGDHCFLDGRDNLKIGSHVAIASHVLIYNSEHNIHSQTFEAIEEPVVIEDYVFIGARVVILPGVKISYGAVVATGAVVTKDVPEKTIVAGVPAKPIGKRKVEKLNYKLGRARLFQ